MFMRYVQNVIVGGCILLGSTSLVKAQEGASTQIQQAIASQQLADSGIQVVQEAQESAPVEAVKSNSANSALQDYCAAKGWEQEWDGGKERYIVIKFAEFDTLSPDADKDFLVKRELAAKQVALEAKAAICMAVNAEVSAMDKLDMPGTDVNKALEGEYLALKQKLAEQKEILANMLQAIDQNEAEAVRETELTERFDDLIVAVIKRLDETYKGDVRQQEAQQHLEKLKTDYAQLIEEYRALQKKAESLDNDVKQKQESMMSVMSRMPLFGATAIKQMESWDGKRYQVAIAFCWSAALERAARSIVTGEKFSIKPSASKKSIHAWLRASNPAMMVGPLQYLDNQGNRWFVGITARPYGNELSSSTRAKNKGLAEMFAMQMALFSLYADVDVQKLAQQKSMTRSAENEDLQTVAESLATSLSQSVQKRKVRGLQQIFGREMIHPISNQQIYVCAYAMNPKAAKAALRIEAVNFATKMMDNQHQTIERGRDDANASAVKASANRAEDRQRGQAAQAGKLNAELDERNGVIRQGNAGAVPPQPQRGVQTPTQKKGATQGVFSGAADDDDDF